MPEGQEPPYAVLEDLGTAYEHTSQPDARKWLEHSRVVFHVWGRGAEEAEDCAESLLDAFAGGGGILEFAGGTKRCQAVLPHSLTVQSEMVRYRDGTLIYRASVGFDIRISKG
ncbi:MAG TPA: hypothetical protein VEI97_01580 [bacterium]|nr:hypothetical protein [bacterium]